MEKFTPVKVVIEEGCENDILTQNIIKNLPDTPREYINPEDNIYLNQKILFIKHYKGNFFKPCPCSPNVVCCGYYVLMNAENCYLNCTYCFLHEYARHNAMIVYSNIDKMFEEIDSMLRENPESFYRIGTGEFSDSLTIDDITEFSKIIVPFFSRYNNGLLELKTKSVNIENLLGLDHKNRTVVSWSVNPDKVIIDEERLSPLLDERLEAAKECIDKMYRIGFHFDPIIYYEGWEEDYRTVVKKIFRHFPQKEIIWISLGTFRFIPELKNIIREKFPQTKIIYGEHVLSSDGKMRYIKPIRVDIYKKMLSWIREYSTDVFVYLCMESKEVWKKVFNLNLEYNHDLEKLFPRT